MTGLKVMAEKRIFLTICPVLNVFSPLAQVLRAFFSNLASWTDLLLAPP